MRSDYEPMLYLNNKGNAFIVVFLYVDDIIYSSSSISLVDEFMSQMTNEFEILLNSKPFATPMNDGAEMDDARCFRRIVGSLTYLAHTHPNIAFLGGGTSKFM
uniref:Reverse transcriptase Ty1/copia-type domain-containing protein n=1 Tax=Solanum lycopersicum TaxID=4081 RepID=A0A3Q7EB86_SOLLC